MILLIEAENRGNLGLALGVCDEMLANTPESTMLRKRRKRIVQRIAKDAAND